MNKIIILSFSFLLICYACSSDEHLSASGNGGTNQTVNDGSVTDPDNSGNQDNSDGSDIFDNPDNDNPDNENVNDGINGGDDDLNNDMPSNGVDSIDIDSPYIVITKGYSREVSVSAVPSSANQIIYYEVKDENIVYLTDNGSKFTVYGNNTGSTQVLFYSYDRKVKAVLDVKVEPVSIERINISDSVLTIMEGATAEAAYSIIPDNADIENLIWSSDNESIAAVDKGTIKGVSPGSTVIRVQSVSGYAKAVIDVHVKKYTNIIYTPAESVLDFPYNASSRILNITNDGKEYDFSYSLTGDTPSFNITRIDKGINISAAENKSILSKNATLQIFSSDNTVLKTIELKQAANPSPVFKQIWVQGVTPHTPAMETDKYGYLDWNEYAGEGWYNVVKLEARAVPSSPDSRMCWAMTSSNILHWWLEQNRDLIDRYEIKTGKKCSYGYFLENKGENEKDVSDIAKLFREKFPNKGGYVEDGINWFLGYYTRPLTEGSPLCFEEAFKYPSKKIVEEKILFTLKDFSRELKSAMENGKAIGLDYILNGGGHAITVWGGEFDEEGIVRNVYIVDSNYPYHVMTTLGVYEQDNLIYLRNLNFPERHTNWRILQISTVDLMRDALQAYIDE